MDKKDKKQEEWILEKRGQKIKSKLSENRSKVISQIFSVGNKQGISNSQYNDFSSSNIIITQLGKNYENKEENPLMVQEQKQKIKNIINNQGKISSKNISCLLEKIINDKQPENPSYGVQFCIKQSVISAQNCKYCNQPIRLGKLQSSIEGCIWRYYGRQCDKFRL